MEDKLIEKRKKAILSGDESRIIKWLYLRTLIPLALAILISSATLFFGLQSLMNRASFTNYGIAPSSVTGSASKFVTTYFLIAASNIVLIIVLSTVVMYIVLHDLVLPLMRVTRELKESIQIRKKEHIIVRSTDRLLKPLVDLINKMITTYH